ncbi:hypothetical protein HPT25_05730 [Bacillus sp. BRMEA1]|nr:hypothetical protein [Neobacillus endophyticus]NRD76994.1 hypothetical protein [Neobacillus endophyticus]
MKLKKKRKKRKVDWLFDVFDIVEIIGQILVWAIRGLFHLIAKILN